MEDIAQNKTPNTQNDILTAERNLELRMQQPAYFDYPTPRLEAAPQMPTVIGWLYDMRFYCLLYSHICIKFIQLYMSYWAGGGIADTMLR